MTWAMTLQPSLGVRRAVFLSGMSGEEVSEVIGAYNDSGDYLHTAVYLLVARHFVPLNSTMHEFAPYSMRTERRSAQLRY